MTPKPKPETRNPKPGALLVGGAIAAMKMTDTVHPPVGAYAVLLADVPAIKVRRTQWLFLSAAIHYQTETLSLFFDGHAMHEYRPLVRKISLFNLELRSLNARRRHLGPSTSSSLASPALLCLSVPNPQPYIIHPQPEAQKIFVLHPASHTLHTRIAPSPTSCRSHFCTLRCLHKPSLIDRFLHRHCSAPSVVRPPSSPFNRP
jgi:hypothetical protein